MNIADALALPEILAIAIWQREQLMKIDSLEDYSDDPEQDPYFLLGYELNERLFAVLQNEDLTEEVFNYLVECSIFSPSCYLKKIRS